MGSCPPARSRGPGRKPTVRVVLAHYALLVLTWIGAWTLFRSSGLESQSEAVATAYWTLDKLLIWLAPIFAIVGLYVDEPATAYLSIQRHKRGVIVGIVCGVVFVGISFLRDVSTRAFAPPELGPGLVNALLIAPLFEELLFRGFILKSLQASGLGFWSANVAAAVMFLGMHLPGWYFMASPAMWHGATIVGIVAVGLVAGLAKHRSQSLWGSVIFHLVNNLYSSALR